jgi:hypothetical protein
VSGYHGDCIARAKYRALESEASDQRDLVVALERLLAERDATIARLTAERADVYDEGWHSGENDWANTNPYRDALDAEGQEPAAEWCERGHYDCRCSNPHRPAGEPVPLDLLGALQKSLQRHHADDRADVPTTSDNGTGE